MPPPEEEDPKKKAPSKAKGQVEEVKPVHGKAWLDLSRLKGPTEQDIYCTRAPVSTILKLPDGVEAQQTDYVYENAQTYIKVGVHLSEAINGPSDESYYAASEYRGKVQRTEPVIGSEEILTEFHRTITQITHEVSREYTRFFSGEGGAAVDETGSPRNKPGSAVYQTAAQLREMREQKKEKFLHDFNTSPKYLSLRDKFKKAVLRFVVEKYKKEVGSKPLTLVEKEKFKADLYVYMNEQTKAMINRVIDYERENLHQDIPLQRDVLRDERQAKINKAFIENAYDHNKRIAKEYDIIGDKENTERWLQYQLASGDY